MLSSEHVPTRSAILQARDEHAVVLEAYDFLDEKRLLLAAELLRQLKQYEMVLDEYKSLQSEALQMLVAAVGRHGLHGIQVYPAHYLEDCELQSSLSRFMGVALISTELSLPGDMSPGKVCHSSPEAESCRDVFLALLKLAGKLSGLSGNIYRLSVEYRRTERRARALENVVIPEIEQDLREMSVELDELDQEEVVRLYLQYSSPFED